jgi:hypothetical protein
MIVLRDPQATSQITNPNIRNLVVLRFGQLNSPDDPDAPDADGHFIVVEPGDTVEQLDQVVGLPILRGLFDDLLYGHPDFTPCFEILEEHNYEQHSIYEMVFISDDDGTFTALLIPATEGVDSNLLAMCRSFATPAVSLP